MSPSSTTHHEQIYSQLVTCFHEHVDEVFELEILPSTLQSQDGALMRDGTSYGISKRILAVAFIHARQIFFQNSGRVGEEEHLLANDASKVMLLFAPEHITAANFRKRSLLRAKSQLLFRQELNFLTSILTSPLHRHAKSPTLWSQRVWVMQQILPELAASSAESHFLQNMTLELDTIMKAAERHPTNYYAWNYARKLFRLIEALYLDGETYGWHPEYPLFVVFCTNRIKGWCMKHPSDTSGWNFLYELLPLLPTDEAKQDIVKNVLQYALHLQIGNKSLWGFIRTVLADDTLAKAHQIQLNQKLSQLASVDSNTEEASDFHVGAEQAIHWVKVNREPV